MHRLIVAILAAVDAAIAVAVGIAATLAPLTLLWIFGFGDGADWGALWSGSAVIWQFGNLVPLAVTIPADYVAAVGIEPDAASFTLSLAPLAFAAFTAIFAARSGVRASQADAWITGVLSGSGTFAVLAAVVALTSANGIAEVELWQAILFPALVFALPALVAAVVLEWNEAGAGGVARLRDRVESASHGWGDVPGLIARGSAVVVVGLIGFGALITAVALVFRGGEVIALYEAAHLDLLGAIVVTLGQLAYLPTIVVWGLAFVAGPGFAVGEGTSVSPAGTQVGVVPGIPILGIIPESTTPWLLLLALGPIAIGALAGWIARSRLVGEGRSPGTAAPAGPPLTETADTAADAARTAVLAALLVETATSRAPRPDEVEVSAPTADGDPIGARLVVALGIAVLAAGVAALLAAVASGSIGPGALVQVGPAPGPVALAVGLEVLVGAGILLLSPRAGRRAARSTPSTNEPPAVTAVPPHDDAEGEDDVREDEGRADAAPDADVKPREPFTFPTLPRMPGGSRDPGEGGAGAPVD